MQTLYDPEAEAYLDRLPGSEGPGRVAIGLAPFEENALMARVLLSFAALSGDPSYAQQAEAMLRRHARDYRSQGLFAAGYAAGVLDALDPPVDVHIVGAPSAAPARALRAAALRITSPPMRIDPIDPVERRARAAEFAISSGSPNATLAALCKGTTCFAKVTTPGELVSAMTRVSTTASNG